MKQLIFLLVISLLTNFAKAQVYTNNQSGCGIKYEYDNAGNRIKRYKHCWTAGLPSARPTKDSSLVAITKNKLSLSVYPNPTINNFTVSLSEVVSDGVVSLQDLNRKLIQRKHITGQSTNFNIESLASGTYFVVFSQVSTKEKLIRKIDKQ
jgi:hypothetical protein